MCTTSDWQPHLLYNKMKSANVACNNTLGFCVPKIYNGGDTSVCFGKMTKKVQKKFTYEWCWTHMIESTQFKNMILRQTQ